MGNNPIRKFTSSRMFYTIHKHRYFIIGIVKLQNQQYEDDHSDDPPQTVNT